MPTVGDLGEKEFIRSVLAKYSSTADAEHLEDCMVIDCSALFDVPGLPAIVYSMDHPSRIDRPLPEDMSWRFWGRWIAACTCNDVIAMGAIPRGLAVDLAVPTETDLTVVTELYEGLHDVLSVYGATLEGGNTDINSKMGTVAVSWGTLPPPSLIRRRGAQPGDVIATTTELGVGWATYVLRKRGLFDKLQGASQDQLREYNLLPIAWHFRAVNEAVTKYPGGITSGMDLSDGLAEFLHLIAESGSGAVVDAGLLPTSDLLRECCEILQVPREALAIELGYDMPRAHGYTIAAERWNEISDIFTAAGHPLIRIGEVTTGGGPHLRRPDGRLWPVPKLWDDKCYRESEIERWTKACAELTSV